MARSRTALGSSSGNPTQGKPNHRVASCPEKPLPSDICKCIGINASLLSWLAVCCNSILENNSRPDQLEKAPCGAFFENIFVVFIETVVSEYRVLGLPVV